MYKIVTDITLIDQINEACKRYEDNQESNYCQIEKHPIRNEWVIPIIEGILRKYNLSFIEELLTDNIEELPEDWLWPYMERTYRVKIPYKLQAQAIRTKNTKKDECKLRLLIETLSEALPEQYSFYDSDYIITYLEEIYSTFSSCGNDESDLEVLQMFDEIIIEHYETLTKSVKEL